MSRPLTYSLAWLVAHENLSEHGMAGFKGSGFKKGCIIILYNYSTESSAAGQSCTDPVILEFSFLEGELLARANSICLCEKGILY